MSNSCQTFPTDRPSMFHSGNQSSANDWDSGIFPFPRRLGACVLFIWCGIFSYEDIWIETKDRLGFVEEEEEFGSSFGKWIGNLFSLDFSSGLYTEEIIEIRE